MTRISARRSGAAGAAAHVHREAWRQKLFRMLGLVLAAAAAEGLTRVPQQWLVTAPLTDAVTEVLRPAALRRVRVLGPGDALRCVPTVA